MKFRSILTGALASLALVACASWHLEPAQSFRQELSAQYMRLARADGRPIHRWFNPTYFAAKSYQAAHGVDVQPEQPDTWNIPHEERDELKNAYDMLQIALVPDRKKVTKPVPAAQAQAAFDCWVEQADRNFIPSSQEKDCKAAFYEAFCRMYGGQCNASVKSDQIFRIYFDTNKTRIDAAGQSAIAAAVASYKQGASEIIVAGHADRVGKSDANLRLSKARADAVRARLVRAGVPASKVMDRYFGEKAPLVPTPDEVPNRNNRRVLIVVR
ncbi:MAG: ompA family protein [Alphaproteobacteria bacterium]|nr:ompA family protein [Alphaproteobacteria bacterium]